MSEWLAGLKNLLYWLPVIWKDRWWDHAYLARIVQHKLCQMEQGQRQLGNGVDSEIIAKRMREVNEHLKRAEDIDKFHPVEVGAPLLLVKEQVDLASWHWREAFRKIARTGECWWD